MATLTAPPATTHEVRPHAGPQERFLASPADIAIYGGAAGAGKSYALLLEPLRHVHVPGFGAVIFRRIYPEITRQGGLWDQSWEIYPHFGAVPNQTELSWTFPSGARVRFAHLQHDRNVMDWKGAQIPLIGFDQLEEFSASQFWYLLSRNRSLCGVRPYVRATCNPVPDDDPVGGWLPRLIAWWLDPDTGYPVPDRSGVVRWFVRAGDELVWADDPAELRARHPALPPTSLTFVPGRLEDNPALERADTQYRGRLLALPLVERERLLGGNWKIRPTAGKIFDRAWFELVGAVPARSESVWVRYWDKAATEDGGAMTAGVLMGRSTKTGLYYIADAVYGQWSALRREEVIRQTAELDGRGVHVVIEQEPGSGGKESAEATIRMLAGFIVRADRPTGSKVERAMPLSAQAEAGNVKILGPRPWNETLLDQLHRFSQDRPHELKDLVDAAVGAFSYLSRMTGRQVGANIPAGTLTAGLEQEPAWRLG